MPRLSELLGPPYRHLRLTSLRLSRWRSLGEFGGHGDQPRPAPLLAQQRDGDLLIEVDGAVSAAQVTRGGVEDEAKVGGVEERGGARIG